MQALLGRFGLRYAFNYVETECFPQPADRIIGGSDIDTLSSGDDDDVGHSG
jgi:hypothetical protein